MNAQANDDSSSAAQAAAPADVSQRVAQKIKARVFPYREKVASGNIVWAERDRGSMYYRVSRYAGHNGKFAPDHPVAPNSSVFGGTDSQCGSSDSLKAFQGRGYWASCFPEGDGITWKPLNGQSDDRCLCDIRECFPMLDADWGQSVNFSIGRAKATGAA